jgi:serine/threonine protein kinase
MGCLHLKLVPNISLAGSVFNVFWYCLSAMICLKKDGCFCDPPCKRKHLHRCPTHKLSCNIPSLVALFVPLQDGIYTLPCHLSMQARDLITRILKTDPLRRTTISEIRCHPWFQVHLPLYLAVPPPEYAQQLKRIDEDVASRVEKLGFDHNHLIDCLHRREATKATVTYYLLLDSLHSENQDDYLESEFEELSFQS